MAIFAPAESLPSPVTLPVIISLQRDKRQKGRKRDKKADRTKDKKIKWQSWRQTLGSKKCCSQPFRICHCNFATLRRPRSRQLLIFTLESGNQSTDQIYCRVTSYLEMCQISKLSSYWYGQRTLTATLILIDHIFWHYLGDVVALTSLNLVMVTWIGVIISYPTYPLPHPHFHAFITETFRPFFTLIRFRSCIEISLSTIICTIKWSFYFLVVP